MNCAARPLLLSPSGLSPSCPPLSLSFSPAHPPVLRSRWCPLFLFSAPSSEPKHTAPSSFIDDAPRLGCRSYPPHRGFTPECHHPSLSGERSLRALPSPVEAALTSPFLPHSSGTSSAPSPTPSLARTPPRAAAPSRHTTSPSPRQTGGFYPSLTCSPRPPWAHGTQPGVLVDP
jgi:hypothetical protein